MQKFVVTNRTRRQRAQSENDLSKPPPLPPKPGKRNRDLDQLVDELAQVPPTSTLQHRSESTNDWRRSRTLPRNYAEARRPGEVNEYSNDMPEVIFNLQDFLAIKRSLESSPVNVELQTRPSQVPTYATPGQPPLPPRLGERSYTPVIPKCEPYETVTLASSTLRSVRSFNGSEGSGTTAPHNGVVALAREAGIQLSPAEETIVKKEIQVQLSDNAVATQTSSFEQRWPTTGQRYTSNFSPPPQRPFGPPPSFRRMYGLPNRPPQSLKISSSLLQQRFNHRIIQPPPRRNNYRIQIYLLVALSLLFFLWAVIFFPSLHLV